MKEMWCWRCGEAVPMLDEDEFAVVHALWKRAFDDRDGLTREFGVSLAGGSDALFRPMREAYERLTGWKDMPQAAIMHHRITIYGPPCAACGKPLRTPRARWCAACGAKVASSETAVGERDDAPMTDGTSE